jgi:hypothetical protein
VQTVLISDVGWSFWTPPTNNFLIMIHVVNHQNQYVVCLGIVELGQNILWPAFCLFSGFLGSKVCFAQSKTYLEESQTTSHATKKVLLGHLWVW